jgi:hypothetical protein
MGMQTDVKSNHLNSSGSVYGAPTRLKGFSAVGVANQAGTVIFRDGGSSGPIVCEYDIVSNSNPNAVYMLVPGEGIRCTTSLYAALTNVTGITVFYG